MPLGLQRPRPRTPRYALRILQRYRLWSMIADLGGLMPALLALSTAAPWPVQLRARCTAAMVLVAVAGAQLLLALPRDSSATAIPQKGVVDFGEAEFMDHFRYARRDFYRLLACLDMAHVADPTLPRYMHVGTRVVRTEWALLVLLKRLTCCSTYKDLRFVLGGSKTTMCQTFLCVLHHVYVSKCDRVTSLLPWEDFMLDFVDMWRARRSPFEWLVGLIDGHLQPTCRPGGYILGLLPRGASLSVMIALSVDICVCVWCALSAGCVHDNVFDFQTFNGKARLHGFKFQGILLPNG